MIIALESASSDPSLALATPDGSSIAVDGWLGEGRQASELLPRLLALLASAGRELRETTALAVGTGPGSFTGLRVSMSLAKGLSLALRVPLVGVPSLAAWLDSEPQAAAAVTRAGAQEAFLMIRDQPEARIVPAADLAGLLAGSIVMAPTELAEAFALVDTRSPQRAAGAIAASAATRLNGDPRGDDLDRLEPWYVQAPRGVAPTAAEVR